MATQLKAPLPLLILDVIGSLMMLAGIIEHFGWFKVIPEAWSFPYQQAVLLIGGLFLITPYQFVIVLEALKRKRKE